MTVNKTMENGKITLAIEGNLVSNTAPQFQKALFTAFDEAKEVVLDFSGVDYIASAGLRVLLTGNKEAKKKGASITLSNVSQDVMDVFELTGFTDKLTFI